ncbi:MAG TPA: hypothetical protein ENK26_15150 [Gammaproteobacteria bacterium]|nr:hypothetical protein [Gammaproteobacteria bacterium]
MFTNTRTKWLSLALLILIGASVSGSLTAGETGFFYFPPAGNSPFFISMEPLLWLLGCALLGMVGMKRFGENED